MSAVDPHVANEIFDKLISNDKSVLRNKTRLLVTHATQFLPRCDRIVLLAKGKIVDQGTYQEVYDANPAFQPILKVFTHFEQTRPSSSSHLIRSNCDRNEFRKFRTVFDSKVYNVPFLNNNLFFRYFCNTYASMKMTTVTVMKMMKIASYLLAYLIFFYLLGTFY